MVGWFEIKNIYGCAAAIFIVMLLKDILKDKYQHLLKWIPRACAMFTVNRVLLTVQYYENTVSEIGIKRVIVPIIVNVVVAILPTIIAKKVLKNKK